MKFNELNPGCQARLSAKLSASSKKNGFKSGKDHPNWNGGSTRDRDGYISVLVDSDSPHYKMGVDGYVKRARLLIAKDLGRCLKPNEITHHINGIKDDDRIENLMLFQGNGKHTALHHRLRKLSK